MTIVAGAAEQAPSRGHLAPMALAALGVVYGDIGTSPLYTFKTAIAWAGGEATPAAVLGMLSLIVWTLVITTSIKYVAIVMRADNDGEGGILALMSLRDDDLAADLGPAGLGSVRCPSKASAPTLMYLWCRFRLLNRRCGGRLLCLLGGTDDNITKHFGYIAHVRANLSRQLVYFVIKRRDAISDFINQL